MKNMVRPRGVHGRLMVALGALVGLTLLAGVTGWLGFSRTETALETLQADSLSDLALVLTLAERSASLAARAPYMAELRSERQIAAGREEIELRLAEFTELAVRLPLLKQQSTPRPTDVPSAVRLAARLEGILRALLDVTGERLAIDATMAHALTALADFRTTLKMLESRAAFDGGAAAVTPSQFRALQDLGELVLEASAAETTMAAEALRSRFSTAFAKLDPDLVERSQIPKRKGDISALTEKIVALEPIFFERLRQISAQNRTRFLLAAINTASSQLTATVSSLAAVVRSSALTRSEETISVLRYGKSALLAIAGLCLLAALGAASFVMRDVATNLRSATNAMTRLAAGDRSAEVPGTGREDELGDLARAFGVFKEQAIEREELAAKLAENAKLLQAIFDNLSNGISLFDSEGKLLAWNPRFAELSGLEADAFRAGVPITSLLDQLYAVGARARTLDYRSIDLTRLARIRLAPFTLLELLFPDGHIVEIRSGAMPNGGMIASLADVTSRKVMERQLRQAQKMEAVGQLTGGIAHDFNNRLAAIIGNLQMIQDDASASEKIRKRSLRALDAAEGGAAMTQRLLAFARRQVLQPRPTDLNSLVENLSDLIGYSLDPGIELVMDLDHRRPSAMIDSGQMENALLNLIFNSRDAIEGKGRITISSSVAPMNENSERAETILCVSDSGVGMTSEVRARVLEPFFTTKAFGRGSGLGLSMVYGFIRQSGGRIEIDSTPRQGTSVRLFLPATDIADLEPGSRAEDRFAPIMTGRHILLVEDDDLVRETAFDMLADLGYRTTAVATAEAALEAVKTESFDLVFTDVVLAGGIHGPDLGKALAATHPDLPVLYCSGFARDAARQLGALPLPERILEKPYRKEILAQRLAETLASPVA